MHNFEDLLVHYIDENNGKVSEYQLLTLLERQHPDFFEHLPDKTRLYERHFWLFHTLYKIKHNWNGSNRFLSISALEISYGLTNIDNNHIGEHDPLADFYLDKENLYLPESTVADMQRNFWRRYLALNEKADAIKVLGLTGKAPLTLKDIKRNYQKLAATHHPDKGGAAEDFSRVKKAYQDLLVLFQ